MIKAKQYLEDTINGSHYSGDYYNRDLDQGTPKLECGIDVLDAALEISFIEGQLKIIRDSEMCNAGERELEHRLKQLFKQS